MPRAKRTDKSKTNRRNTPPPVADDPEGPDLDSPDDSLSDIDPVLIGGDVDLFEELFDYDSQEEVVVHLYRVEPVQWTVDGQSVPIKGYLETLHPGESDYHGLIKSRYGGGRYLVQRRINARIDTQRTLIIAGAPRVITEPAPRDKAPSSALPMDEQHSGVSIGGTEQQFEERLTRLAMIQKIMNPPAERDGHLDDLTKILLERALSGNQTSMIETITTVTKAAEALGPVFQRNTGETGILDVILEGIKTIPDLLAQRQGGAPPVKQLGMIPGTAPINVRKLPAPEANAEGDTTDTPEQETTMALDMKTLLNTALYNVAAAFRLKPRPEPADVIQMLDAMMEADGPMREKLKAHKATATMMIRTNLSDYFEDNPEAAEQFEQWWTDLFDTFTDPERKAAKIE